MEICIFLMKKHGCTHLQHIHQVLLLSVLFSFRFAWNTILILEFNRLTLTHTSFAPLQHLIEVVNCYFKKAYAINDIHELTCMRICNYSHWMMRIHLLITNQLPFWVIHFSHHKNKGHVHLFWYCIILQQNHIQTIPLNDAEKSKMQMTILPTK